MPEEEKKKKRKLVVEETSASEPVIEAEIPEEETSGQLDSVATGQLDNETTEEVMDEEKSEESRTEEAEEEKEVIAPKKESPKKSILIPMDEKELGSRDKGREGEDSKVSAFWVFALVLFIIASLVGGGVLIFKAGVEKGKLEAGATPESAATTTPSPTASSSVEVKREDLKVQVLNGTGKAGVAGAAKEYLEGLDYKDVETGNADSSDFSETVISIKDAKKDFLETLKTDLAKKYKVSASTSTLSSGSDFDAVVTVGSD